MAQQVHVEIIDDLDGSKADHKGVIVGWEGKTYSLDLSEENYEALKAELEPFIKAGTLVTGKATRPTGTRPKVDREQLAAVRAWARQHGYAVKDRGRIPVEVVEAYNAAA